MSATATETITVDRAELRDIAVDVGAMWDYLTDMLGPGDDMESGPMGRLGTIHTKLENLMGVALPEGGTESTPFADRERESMFEEESNRSHLWQREDREVFLQLLGGKLAQALGAVLRAGWS